MDQREDFVIQSFDPRINFRSLCRKFGISTKTGYKWKERFAALGRLGLYDRSKRPHRSSNQVLEDVVCDIIRLKTAHPNWGPKKIHNLYRRMYELRATPSLSTFNRIFEKAGLVIHKRRRKQSNPQRMQSATPVLSPNDLWTVDFKGFWYTTLKERCEPLTVRDAFSRYILSIKTLPSSRTEDVQDEFERLFKKHGLPKAIRSDNGPPFAHTRSLFGLSKLSVWWMSLGIKLDRIEPGKPYQNGAHERMHKDLKNELQNAIPGDIKAHQAAFDQWRDEFNHKRPHEALKMKTPASVYVNSDNTYDNNPVQIIYPFGFTARSVDNRGAISFFQNKVFISSAFSYRQVGLKRINSNSFEVWYDHLKLGLIDLSTFVFKPMNLTTV
jgi:transposase InsO family protein